MKIDIFVEERIIAFCKKAMWFVVYACMTIMAIICFSRSEIGQGLAWSLMIANMLIFFPQMFRNKVTKA